MASRRFTLLERLILRLGGRVHLGRTWLGAGYGDVYAFRCTRHGVVESRVHGWEKELRCPICVSELLEETEIVSPSFV